MKLVDMPERLGATFLVLIAICGCGGSSTKSTAPATAIATPTTNSATSALAAWCKLTTGEPESQIESAMGSPNSHRLDSTLSLFPAGTTLLEWDMGNYIFSAAIEGGTLASAQAYSAADSSPISPCSRS
jgi:hypothetical protein